MTLTILVFGELSRKINSDRFAISTNLPISARDLLDLIEILKPEFGHLINYCSIASNGVFISEYKLITTAEEIALLPPVSGG